MIFGAWNERACHSGVLSTQAMAPKSAAQALATSRTKAAGELLLPSKQARELADKRKVLKTTLKKLAQEKKKAARVARKLKATASKTDLGELMQMLIMKAYIVCEEDKAKSGGASSSTDPWIPKNATEAFETIQKVCPEVAEQSVASFATLLRGSA